MSSPLSLVGRSGPVDEHATTLHGQPRYAQRPLDLFVALFALGFAIPIMLLAAAAIRLTSRGPVVFRQTRIGQHGREFTLLKLRTMRVDSDDCLHREFNTRELLGGYCETTSGILKPDRDPRILPVGRVLRRLSIDELPQLFNVIRGDMSLVGPRPSLPWEVEMYTKEQKRRHVCRPGMTGLWQVSGRNRLSMSEMLALDLAYVESQSLLLDLRILLRTPHAVLGHDTN
jgi:lipopolysaccharide/colanic/teichoic acid biosynthesis glycosyltransferase